MQYSQEKDSKKHNITIVRFIAQFVVWSGWLESMSAIRFDSILWNTFLFFPLFVTSVVYGIYI